MVRRWLLVILAVSLFAAAGALVLTDPVVRTAVLRPLAHAIPAGESLRGGPS